MKPVVRECKDNREFDSVFGDLSLDEDKPIKCQLLNKLNFDERIRGDHHIFTKCGIEEILDLQLKRSKAKQYQEFLSNAEVVIQEWIETAEELGTGSV